jgi:aquaporin Z
LIHLIGIPVTNTSVNPARSTGPALFVGGWAIAQLWAFWVAPILGAAVAGFAYRWLRGEVAATRVVATETQTVGTGAAAEEAVIKRK